MNIAESIRRRRLELGLTQEQLAARLKIRQSQVSALETGAHKPSLDLLERLAKALETQARDPF